MKDQIARPTAPEAPIVTLLSGRWLKISVCVVALAGGLGLYSREVTKNFEGQIKQALQQEHGETDKLARELATDLAQLKQTQQQDRNEADKVARELIENLAQFKHALQQEHDNSEKLIRELTDDSAKVKHALQEEIEKADKEARVVAERLAQVTQALQRERARAVKLADDLAQVEQAVRQDRDNTSTVTNNLAQVEQALRQDRYETDKLASELTVDLTQVKQALQRMERQSKVNEALLVGQRARNEGRDETQAERAHTTSAGNSTTANLPEASGPILERPTDRTTALLSNGKQAMPVGDKLAATAALEAIVNPEEAHLMERASLLLSQGNIGAARIVLSRVAETGNAQALFELAETYDPTILAAWRAIGTQGDAAKARELYAKAFSAGFQKAGDRLSSLRE